MRHHGLVSADAPEPIGPEVAALSMSASSTIDAVNAVASRRPALPDQEQAPGDEPQIGAARLAPVAEG